MLVCTDRAAVDAIFAAKCPRDVEGIMRDVYPDATQDANGRFHAPCDGYICPITDQTFRGGEYLPFITDDELEERGGERSCGIRSVSASYNGEVIGWEGTRGQIAAVYAELKRQTNEADQATSSHIGVVGQKVEISATVQMRRGAPILRGRFQVGVSWFFILRSNEGNLIVYKGSKDIGGNGDAVKMLATVKDHTSYNGIKQTVVQRPKMVI
jgi:hypothetical protein